MLFLKKKGVTINNMDSSLIQILKSFNRDELKDFEKLIKSPFFKKERDVLPLYKYLIRFHPEFQKDKIDKKEVFRRLYKNKSYNDQLMRTLFSDLQRLSKEYLIQLKLRDKNIYRHIFAIIELSKRRIDKLSERETVLLDARLEKEKFKIEDYFHQKLESDFLKITCHLQLEDYKYFHKKISTLSENLVCMLLENLSYSINVIKSFSASANTEADLNILNDLIKKIDFGKVLSDVKKRSESDYLIAALAYYSIISVLYPKEDDYFRFKELLTENYYLLSQDNTYNYFSYLERACMFLSLSQREKFDKELFGLGVFQLANNIYTHSQMPYLSETLFRSYLIRAFIIGEYNWILEFIDHYKNKLPPDSDSMMELYTSAYRFFCLKDYKNTLINIAGLPSDKVQFMTEIKKLALMTLYEEGLTEDCYYSADAFKHYLKENKYINQAMKKINMDFISLYLKLINIKTGSKEIDKTSFITEVKRSKTEYYHWLIEKAEELEKMQ